jgi:hypothetical protein
LSARGIAESVKDGIEPRCFRFNHMVEYRCSAVAVNRSVE